MWQYCGRIDNLALTVMNCRRRARGVGRLAGSGHAGGKGNQCCALMPLTNCLAGLLTCLSTCITGWQTRHWMTWQSGWRCAAECSHASRIDAAANCCITASQSFVENIALEDGDVEYSVSWPCDIRSRALLLVVVRHCAATTHTGDIPASPPSVLQQGVLTLKLGDLGTYVINKQVRLSVLSALLLRLKG